MKKVISGKMYDTSTAKKLCSATNGLNNNDLKYSYEALYLKKTGEYFLYSEGGQLSQYSKPFILPLLVSLAKTWAEHNLTWEEYESIFEVEQEGKISKLFKLSREAVESLEEMKTSFGTNYSDMVDTLIKKEYKRIKTNAKKINYIGAGEQDRLDDIERKYNNGELIKSGDVVKTWPSYVKKDIEHDNIID